MDSEFSLRFMEGYYIGLGCDLFGYRECRRGQGIFLLVLFIEFYGFEFIDKGWVWFKGKIVIGYGKNVRFGEIYQVSLVGILRVLDNFMMRGIWLCNIWQGKKVVNYIG